jgi:hypothetical protein
VVIGNFAASTDQPLDWTDDEAGADMSMVAIVTLSGTMFLR